MDSRRNNHINPWCRVLFCCVCSHIRRDVNVDALGLKRLIMTFKASIHFTSKTLPGGEFDWGGTSPKQ